MLVLEIFSVFVLAATAGLVFLWAYKYAWNQVNMVFELIPQVNLDQSEFSLKFHNVYSNDKITKWNRAAFSASVTGSILSMEIFVLKLAFNVVSVEPIWSLVSVIVSACVLLIQPYLLSYMFLDKINVVPHDKLVLVSGGVVGFYLCCLTSMKFGIFGQCDSILMRLSLIGVTLMAILAAVASVTTPYHVYKNGRDIQYFQLGFLVYCVQRLISTFVVKIPAILSHAWNFPHDYDYEFYTSPHDPLALTVAKIVGSVLQVSYDVDFDSLIHMVSIVLCLGLFLASFTTVINTLTNVIHVLPISWRYLVTPMAEFLPSSQKSKKKVETSMIKNLIISELTGVYTLATIMMIRSNLPSDVSFRLQPLFHGNPLKDAVIDIWFDSVYALSTVVVAVCLAVF